MQKVYLAGPDVFAPNALELGDKKKKICLKYGYDAHYPLDVEFKNSEDKSHTAIDIVQSNMNLIRNSDIVLANLNNFRGSEAHPACDSGTAWECGYAYGLGKTVIAYTNNENSIPHGILSNLSYAVSGDAETAISIASSIIFASRKDRQLDTIGIFTLDPDYDDILDVDALTAFKLGLVSAYGIRPNVQLTDKRTQVEKYGKSDTNGYEVEDFGLCCNIMIVLNSNIY